MVCYVLSYVSWPKEVEYANCFLDTQCCDPTHICIDGEYFLDCSPEFSTECSIPTAIVTTTTTITLFGTTTAISITTATERTTITDIITTTKPTTTTANVITITTTTQAICPLGGIPCGQQCVSHSCNPLKEIYTCLPIDFTNSNQKCTNGSTCD